MKLDKTVKKAKGKLSGLFVRIVQFCCLSGLRLTISGICHAKWTEGGGRSSVTYQGEQVIINAFVYFFGSKDNQDPIEVPQGTHFYNHSIRVPQGAPSSAEGKHGYIRYKASVNLDIPFMPDLTSEADFVVMRPENLNFYPELKLANEVEEVKTFCCFLCETDPIMVKLSMSKSGYVPGDKVPVKVEIFNKSNISFPKSTISLNRVETYLSYTPLNKTKTFTAPVTEVKSKGTDPKKNRKFEEIVEIPEEVDVSNEKFCDVFQVSYEISFYMKQANKSSSIQASIPIYIGECSCKYSSWNFTSLSIYQERLDFVQSHNTRSSQTAKTWKRCVSAKLTKHRSVK